MVKNPWKYMSEAILQYESAFGFFIKLNWILIAVLDSQLAQLARWGSDTLQKILLCFHPGFMIAELHAFREQQERAKTANNNTSFL